jgi:parallel beta-helix repeat protein
VKNGSITGVGYIGVALGEEAEVTNVHVRWCAAGGISADKYSTVSGNRAHSNGFGIAAGDGSVISGNTIAKNSSYGIVTFNGSTVSGNAVSSNGIDGIFVQNGSVVSGNAVRNNTGYGIRFQSTAGSGSGYSGNVIFNNTAGTVTATGYAVEFGQNVCDGNTTCP